MPGWLSERSLVFVVGKGGVGKSTVAASLALAEARHGKRVLVVEVDAKGDVARALGLSAPSFRPSEARPGVFVMEMDTQRALEEYLRIYARLPFAGRVPGLGRIFDFVATAAPGVRELLVIGKVCYEVRREAYDQVIVDAPASGHVVSQLGVAGDVRELVQLGMVRDQTGWMLDMLGDERRTAALLVTTPEERPVEEAIELASRIVAETPVHLAGAVINRRFLAPLSAAEEPALARVRALAGRVPGLEEVIEASELFGRIAESHAGHVASFAEGMPPGLPIATVGEYFGVLDASALVEEVSEALEVELW
jgi:Mrp family chromosome partitioning ATPase